MIFPHLPVKNVAASTAFYEALGFTRNAQFSDERVASMVVNEYIVVMLMDEPRWKEFTPKTIPDAKTTAEVMLAFSAESREEVDALYEKGLAAGGSQGGEPQDHGFMFSRGLEDPDGHTIEFVWMDPAMIQR